MDVIAHIFEALGEATVIAGVTGDPVQTVHSWKSSGSIPPWRRESVLSVPLADGKELDPRAIAYLKSKRRGAPEVALDQLDHVDTDTASSTSPSHGITDEISTRAHEAGAARAGAHEGAGA